MSAKLAIQNALHAAVSEHACLAVGYADGRAFIVQDEGDDLSVLPVSAFVNETGQQFAPDQRNTQTLRAAISGWQFDALLQYPREVCLQTLVQSLTDPILWVDAGDLGNLMMLLVAYTVEHPPQQDAANGTKAVLSFQALDPHVAFAGD